MKAFFKEHSYSVVKMFLNQFAMSIFGLMLAAASSVANNQTLLVASSIFSILFYMFLLYTMTWELGAKEKIKVEAGRGNNNSFIGLYMSIVANIPNLLLAVLMTVGFVFGSENGLFAYEWAGGLYTVSRIIALLIQGMYNGIISVVGINPIWFFLITFPAMLVSGFSYYIALKYSTTTAKKK